MGLLKIIGDVHQGIGEVFFLVVGGILIPIAQLVAITSVVGAIGLGVYGVASSLVTKDGKSENNIGHEIIQERVIDSRDRPDLYKTLDSLIGEYNAIQTPNKRLLPMDTNKDGFLDAKEKSKLYKVIDAEIKDYNSNK